MSIAELTGQSLFQPIKRAQYDDVLSHCTLISSCYEQGKTQANSAASESHAKMILSNASLLLGKLPEYLASESERFTRCFVKSMYLWLRFPESAGRVHFDSIGSKTLSLYPIDIELAQGDWPLVDKTLLNIGLPESMLSDVKAEVDAQCSNSELKRFIAQFLTKALQSSNDYLAFFQQCYGPVDLPEAMVDVVITDAQIFMCVPYDAEGLIEQHKYGWKEQHNQAFMAFLDNLALESTTERIYFPSVGTFNADAVSVTLIENLTRYIQDQGAEYKSVKSQIVLETLGTMLLLMASQEVEKFLIHDAWGHSWQETLCDFEWLYVKMGKLRERISFVTPSIYSETNQDCLIDAVERNDQGKLQVNSSKLDRWLQCDIRGRVTVALNACVAELTADIPEYKFSEIAQQHGLGFPSSSLLDSQVVRLDLTFNDAAKHINSLTLPYVELVSSESVRETIKIELGECGFSKQESDSALGIIAEHINIHYGALMTTPSNGFSSLKSRESLSLFERLQLNITTHIRVLLMIYCRVIPNAQWTL